MLYSRIPLTHIKWDEETSGYADNPDNWIFLWKEKATLVVRSGKKILQTVVLGYIFNHQ